MQTIGLSGLYGSRFRGLQPDDRVVIDATGVPAVATKLTEHIANGGVGLFSTFGWGIRPT